MCTEDMVETVIEAGVKAYKKNYKNCPEGIKLFRKEPVVLFGIEFNCWREYAVYKMGQYLQELCPTLNIDVELDGNNSTLKLEMSDEEQKKVNVLLWQFIKKAQLA